MEYALFLTGDTCYLPTKLKIRQVSKYLNDNTYLKISISAYKDLIKAFKKIKIEKATKKIIMSFSKKNKNEDTPLLLFC